MPIYGSFGCPSNQLFRNGVIWGPGIKYKLMMKVNLKVVGVGVHNFEWGKTWSYVKIWGWARFGVSVKLQ